MDRSRDVEPRVGRGALRPTEAVVRSSSVSSDLDPGRGTSGGRRLICVACLHPITDEGQRIEVGGRQAHRRTNPFGVTFDFWCFGAAPGAECRGQPTTEHTWFAGHAWSLAVCGGCGELLGWLFEGEMPPRFYGLICARLLIEGDVPGPM